MTLHSPSLDRAVEHRVLADRVLWRVQREDAVWGTYTLELTLDALLEYFLATGATPYRDYVRSVLRRRNLPVAHYTRAERRPFGHFEYSVFRTEGDSRIGQSFARQSLQMREEVSRSPDGLVLHCSAQERPHVLLDFLQEYIARMARAGALTGDTSLFEESATQLLLHREALRDPATGLWRQGVGWDPDDEVAPSPGAWARGQGWMLRGLTDALGSIPRTRPEFGLMRDVLRELLDALRPHQDAQGFWHCLVDEPREASAPETSGTALIAAGIYRALTAGHVEPSGWRDIADHAFNAIAGRVGDDGAVTGACAGPGPLNPTLRRRCLGSCCEQDERHGWFSVLSACAARAAAEGTRVVIRAASDRA